MNQESEHASEIFMDTLVKKQEQQDEKIQAQERRMAQLEERVKTIPNYSEDIRKVTAGQGELKAAVSKLHFPAEKLQEFSEILTAAINLFKKPLESKVVHQHHVPKIIWVSAGLFVALCLVCSGWYLTASTLDQYRANDIKYRYLKLRCTTSLERYLFHIDTLYRSGYQMKDSVVQWEEEAQKAVELNQRLQQNKGEGDGLKEKLHVLEGKDSVRKYLKSR